MWPYVMTYGLAHASIINEAKGSGDKNGQKAKKDDVHGQYEATGELGFV